MSEMKVSDQDGLWALVRASLSSRNFVVGGSITLVVIAMALFSYVWTPFDVTSLNVSSRLHWPDRTNWLGTDHFGRDVFSMIMVGARNSIAVALIAVSIGMAIGVPLGAAAAAMGGWGAEIIMRGNDFVFAFPSLLLAVLLTAIYGPGVVNAMIAIGIFNIPVFARLAFSGSLALWQREFILSARTSGKGSVWITIEHILPNLTNILIVQGTIQFSLAILIEAGLSYLGVGTQPPAPSWGKMLAEAQTMMGFAPYLAIFPGLAIVTTVLGLNLLGDGLRDVLDPKLRRAR